MWPVLPFYFSDGNPLPFEVCSVPILSTRETEGWVSLNNITGCIVWGKDEKPELPFLSLQGIKYHTGHVIYLQ